MKLFAAAFALVMGSTASAQDAVCTCTQIDAVYDFTTVNPNDIDFMEDFPWKVVSCIGTQVQVELVTEDNPLLDSYVLDEDENLRIYYEGEWVRFDEFEPHCTDAPTS